MSYRHKLILVVILFATTFIVITGKGQTSPSGKTIAYKYDALGRVICVIDSKNGTRKYRYDPAGNRLAVTVGTCSS